MHFCLPAFGSVTSLRLTEIVSMGEPDEYNAFRDGLMALPSLNHFEIQLRDFWLSESHLPIVLPTIKFLHLNVDYCIERFDDFIGSIRVPSLATLSLAVGVRPDGDDPDLRKDSLEHFPPLQHLIITNLTSVLPHYEPLACKFSGIERLTYISTSGRSYHDPANELRDVDGTFRWPNMRTMAVSIPDGDFDLSWPFWESTILRFQDAGHPIRKLMLPQALISKRAHNVTKLREFVEIEAFHVDWPDPF
ncbi:hypothetical protein FIBSPDRAFT_952999 [Athelia psychrophila]|uniref:F-box domain-containing protein n=1 Tax=Athelia psychrophila TaxID=1759441 RepID=A0A166KYQ4_9AGAM|nr:hypothetical protein FIBSPDRAFT_952999 [Fibularhizoctonia sp. CBS 109695]